VEWIAALISFFIGYGIGRRRNTPRGNEGESMVRNALVSSFPSENFHLLNNITLPIANGTTQIDHILVSTRGVFVIETKHYSGWIFASANSKKWTQVIYRIKNSFQNPLRQNHLHLKTVEGILDFLPAEAFHPIVVFTGSAQFKTEKPTGVFFLNELLAYIELFPDSAMSLNRVAFSVGRIECARYQITEQTDVEHQQNLEIRHGK
jgi:hypothetical protein